MEIVFTKRFQKHYRKLDSFIKGKVKDSIEIFRENPFDIQLRNHALKGAYSGYRSIDVTGDFRVVFAERSEWLYELVELIDVGTHSELYE